MSARYALYFIPDPETPLAALGSALLGRNSETGEEIPQAHFPDFSRQRWHELTTNARRYGLHATLKAPFFLKQGATENDLLLAAARFAKNWQACIFPRLVLARIGAFFALVPLGESPGERKSLQNINTLAADAVAFFDRFRAAPSKHELARRHPQSFSERQRELLAKWGYPYVFDEYRFHVTLTDTLRVSTDTCAEIRAIKENLQTYLMPLRDVAVAVSSICVCKQITYDIAAQSSARVKNNSDNNNVFMLLQRFRFRGI